jgi:hypothetical protein
LANIADLAAPDTTSTVIATTAYISIHSIHYDMGYKRYDPLTNDTIEILLKCGRSVAEIAKSCVNSITSSIDSCTSSCSFSIVCITSSSIGCSARY